MCGDLRKGLNTETAKLGTFNNFLMEEPSIEALIVLKKGEHVGLLNFNQANNEEVT